MQRNSLAAWNPPSLSQTNKAPQPGNSTPYNPVAPLPLPQASSSYDETRDRLLSLSARQSSSGVPSYPPPAYSAAPLYSYAAPNSSRATNTGASSTGPLSGLLTRRDARIRAWKPVFVKVQGTRMLIEDPTSSIGSAVEVVELMNCTVKDQMVDLRVAIEIKTSQGETMVFSDRSAETTREWFTRLLPLSKGSTATAAPLTLPLPPSSISLPNQSSSVLSKSGNSSSNSRSNSVVGAYEPPPAIGIPPPAYSAAASYPMASPSSSRAPAPAAAAPNPSPRPASLIASDPPPSSLVSKPASDPHLLVGGVSPRRHQKASSLSDSDLAKKKTSNQSTSAASPPLSPSRQSQQQQQPPSNPLSSSGGKVPTALSKTGANLPPQRPISSSPPTPSAFPLSTRLTSAAPNSAPPAIAVTDADESEENAYRRKLSDRELADEMESVLRESLAVAAVRKHAFETIRKRSMKKEKSRTIFQVFEDDGPLNAAMSGQPSLWNPVVLRREGIRIERPRGVTSPRSPRHHTRTSPLTGNVNAANESASGTAPVLNLHEHREVFKRKFAGKKTLHFVGYMNSGAQSNPTVISILEEPDSVHFPDPVYIGLLRTRTSGQDDLLIPVAELNSQPAKLHKLPLAQRLHRFLVHGANDNASTTTPTPSSSSSSSSSSLSGAMLPDARFVSVSREKDAAIEKDLLVFEAKDPERSSQFAIAFVYAKGSDRTAIDMMNNQYGSDEFERFLGLLGEKVRLRGWTKFSGGLDTQLDSRGTHSYYTNVDQFELMFHISTQLPFAEQDPQKLVRARLVQNDVVMVIFREGDVDSMEPYDPNIMPMSVTHVFVLVSPVMRAGQRFYHVSVVTKENVTPFEPELPNPPLFPADEHFREWLLTKLINAQLATRKSGLHFMFTRPRAAMLLDIVQKYMDPKEWKKMEKEEGKNKK